MILPLALPGVVAGSIFTFSLTLGDYITPILVGNTQFIGNVVYRNVLGLTNNMPFAAAYATVPLVVMAVYLVVGAPYGRVRGALMERTHGPSRARLLVAARRPVPLDPDRDCHGLCLQSVEHPELADPGLHLKWFRIAWEDEERPGRAAASR